MGSSHARLRQFDKAHHDVNHTTAPVAIRDAASVLVLDRSGDEPRVLMGQRGKAAVFMPSKFVFPGGALDQADEGIAFLSELPGQTARRLSAEPRPDANASPTALAAAALRELAEETGLLCGSAGPAPAQWAEYVEGGISPDPSGLIYFFRAITPPHANRRYDTRFFLLDTQLIHGDPHDFSRASDELSDIQWIGLAEARQLDLPFITEVVLAEVQRLLRDAKSAPLAEPDGVPFFDNRGDKSRFIRID